MKAVIQLTVGKKGIEIPDGRGKAGRKQLRMTFVEYIFMCLRNRKWFLNRLGHDKRLLNQPAMPIFLELRARNRRMSTDPFKSNVDISKKNRIIRKEGERFVDSIHRQRRRKVNRKYFGA